MIKPTDVTPEIVLALATLRNRLQYEPGSFTADFHKAFQILDNAGVFAAIDEANDYASAEEILAEAAVASVPSTFTSRAQGLDPAEWGDTTSADMARHQGVAGDQPEDELGFPVGDGIHIGSRTLDH